MKKLLVIVMIMGLLLSACSTTPPASEGAGTSKTPADMTTAEVEEVKTTSAQEAQATTAEATRAQAPITKDFSSYEVVTAYFSDTYDYLDEVTASSDDMALLGDSMFISMLGMTLTNVELDYAMHMMADTWEEIDGEMANGGGVYDSSLSKDGELYIYSYANKWNAGHTDEIHMSYNPLTRMVDYYGDNNNPNNPNDRHIQLMIDEEERFFMTVAEFSGNNGQTTLMVIYCDGTEVCYGRSDVAGDTRTELSMDLLEVQPTSWDELSSFGEFETILTYDGSELQYIY